jgi:hypothetical protein
MCKNLNQLVLSRINRFAHYFVWISLEAVTDRLLVIANVCCHVLPMYIVPCRKLNSLDISLYCVNFGVLYIMCNMSDIFMKSRWIPFIRHWEMIQKEIPNMCVFGMPLSCWWLCVVLMTVLGRWPNLQIIEVFLRNCVVTYFLYGYVWNPPKKKCVPSVWTDSKICTSKVTFPMGSVTLLKLTSDFTGKCAKI